MIMMVMMVMIGSGDDAGWIPTVGMVMMATMCNPRSTLGVSAIDAKYKFSFINVCPKQIFG